MKIVLSHLERFVKLVVETLLEAIKCSSPKKKIQLMYIGICAMLNRRCLSLNKKFNDTNEVVPIFIKSKAIKYLVKNGVGVRV